MPKEEWGVKRICPKCAVRFYDLKKDPMTCPSCDAEFTLESLTAPKSRAAVREKPKAEPAAPKKETVEEEEAVVLDDDDDSSDDIDEELLDDSDDDDDETGDLDEIADAAKKEADT